MSKAIALYEGGSSERCQIAVRDDGMLFRRSQRRSRFGQAWSRWQRQCESWSAIRLDWPPETIEAEAARFHRVHADDIGVDGRTWFGDYPRP